MGAVRHFCKKCWILEDAVNPWLVDVLKFIVDVLWSLLVKPTDFSAFGP